MSLKPIVFISAVSAELRSARDLVSKTLSLLGHDAEWQDIFGTEQGDLKAMLRRRIDAADGVIQLIGQCHGFAPEAPDPDFGSVSYTQYEALYARKRGKKAWLILLDDAFPSDPHPAEPEDKRRLQSAYRERIRNESHLWYGAASSLEVQNRVHGLNNELAKLRRRFSRWARLVTVLLLATVGGVVWLLRGQIQTQEQVRKTDANITSVVGHVDHKLDQVKRETSEDPRKELTNMGVVWSTQSFVDALMRGDARVASLFLAGGMAADTSHNGAAAILYIFQPTLPDPVPMLALLKEAGYHPDNKLIDTRILRHYSRHLPPHFETPGLPEEYAAWTGTFAGPALLWVVIRCAYAGATQNDRRVIEFLRQQGADTHLARKLLEAMEPAWGDTAAFQEVRRLIE